MTVSSAGQPSSGEVWLSGHLVCASQAEADIVLAGLTEHIRLTRAEPGCLLFEVTQTDDPMVWRVEERFADGAAFEAHQTRVRDSAWGATTRGIRRDYAVSKLDVVLQPSTQSQRWNSHGCLR